MNPTTTRLINRTAVREKTLAALAEKRPHLATKFTRVSGTFFTKVEKAAVLFIERYVESMSTSGKTIR
jgi:hypothetical protein